MCSRYRMTLEELMNRWQAYAMEQRDDYMNMPMSHANLEKLRVVLEMEHTKRHPAAPATPAAHVTPAHRPSAAKKINTGWFVLLT